MDTVMYILHKGAEFAVYKYVHNLLQRVLFIMVLLYAENLLYPTEHCV